MNDTGTEVPVDLATPGDPRLCAVSTHTSALDAGRDTVLAVCPDQRRLYAAENLFAGGGLVPFWEADAGSIARTWVLPSYARATVFWVHVLPTASTVWMGQVNGPPTSIVESRPSVAGVDVAPSIRGGYLLEAIFDGGQGVRPYGAYVCPP